MIFLNVNNKRIKIGIQTRTIWLQTLQWIFVTKTSLYISVSKLSNVIEKISITNYKYWNLCGIGIDSDFGEFTWNWEFIR